MRPVLRLFPKPKEVELTTEKFSKIRYFGIWLKQLNMLLQEFIIKGELNKFLTSMKKPVFKFYFHINGYLHCTNPCLLFNFHVK